MAPYAVSLDLRWVVYILGVHSPRSAHYPLHPSTHHHPPHMGMGPLAPHHPAPHLGHTPLMGGGGTNVSASSPMGQVGGPMEGAGPPMMTGGGGMGGVMPQGMGGGIQAAPGYGDHSPHPSHNYEVPNCYGGADPCRNTSGKSLSNLLHVWGEGTCHMGNT